ncbi:hypothetical protein QZH56_27305 [Streptomyces olivoreticuli]|uniref:hypothetical protein n=1 Tax=Streptomyces olivoreticuli TaxID=68246 RepID=UPI00265AB710|nr:hypothetical protein [Streptomyces olivoreticuli]WKK22463.1 hypothetical protein QZH56_27305 [Streptomyces olivoreticuli]
MSAKHRLAAVTVLTAAVGAVVWPTAGAFAAGAADKDGHPGRPSTTVRQIQLPDGSHARLTSGEGGTKATVTTQGKQQRTIDTTRPAADIDRLHLRIIGGDTARPTLRAAVDGTEQPSYYDFTSGSLRHTPDATTAGEATKDHQRGTKAAQGHGARPAHEGRSPHSTPHGHHPTPPAATERHGKVRAASSNPVKRVVEAGEAIKGRHDIGTPAIAGAALLAAGGGAYGVRIALRRSGRTERDA